jgi:hypothetical protein
MVDPRTISEIEAVFRGYEDSPAWAAAINKLISIRSSVRGLARIDPAAAKTTLCTIIHELVADLSWLRVHGEVLAKTKMRFGDTAKWNTDFRPRIDNAILAISVSMPE